MTRLEQHARRPRWLCACVIALLLATGCATVTVETVGLFAPAGGRFSVTVPGGAMDAGTLTTGGVFAGAPARTYSTVSASGVRFAVVYADADPSYLAGTPVDAALVSAEQANVETIGGTQQAERTLTIAGNPGREQRITIGSIAYVLRLVFVGNRLYSISVKGSSVQVDEADAVQFLNSFAVAP
ncbi:MAG: hypothetical protein ACRDGI_07335 [Candidatus Limnocylindrales bacterium]